MLSRPLSRTTTLTLAACTLLVPAGSGRSQTPSPCDPAADRAALVQTVYDRATRVPLAGAQVVAEWSATGGLARAVTDSAGRATLCAPYAQPITLRVAYHDVRSGAQPVRLAAERATIHITYLDVPGVYLRGSVLDAATGAPVPQAAVRLVHSQLSVLSDEAGRFYFERIPVGQHQLSVQHLSYAALRLPLVAGADDLDAAIRLMPEAIALEPITVTAFSRRLEGTGYYDREKRGIGHFLDRRQIEAMKVTYSSDLLRVVPGVRIIPQMSRRHVMPNATRGRGNCRYRFMVDGTRTLPDFEMDFISAHAIEGVEIYNGLAEVPGPFRAIAGPDGGPPACGVIAIWTRDGR